MTLIVCAGIEDTTEVVSSGKYGFNAPMIVFHNNSKNAIESLGNYVSINQQVYFVDR